MSIFGVWGLRSSSIRLLVFSSSRRLFLSSLPYSPPQVDPYQPLNRRPTGLRSPSSGRVRYVKGQGVDRTTLGGGGGLFWDVSGRKVKYTLG